MSWRNKLLKASFKNVRFEVSSSQTVVGRRTIVHEYANRSNPYAQDNGRLASEYSIDGYIVQNVKNNFDHYPERNRLIAAFNSFGPGILIHPHLGIKRVSVKGAARISENPVTEGGMIKFSVTFVEAGQRLPNIIEEGKELVDNYANVSQDISADDFVQNYQNDSEFLRT